MCISALTVLRDMGLEQPAGAVLISPWVDLTHSFPSVMKNTATVCRGCGNQAMSVSLINPEFAIDIDRISSHLTALYTKHRQHGRSNVFRRKEEPESFQHRQIHHRNLDMLIRYGRVANKPRNSLMSVWMPDKRMDGLRIPKN